MSTGELKPRGLFVSETAIQKGLVGGLVSKSSYNRAVEHALSFYTDSAVQGGDSLGWFAEHACGGARQCSVFTQAGTGAASDAVFVYLPGMQSNSISASNVLVSSVPGASADAAACADLWFPAPLRQTASTAHACIRAPHGAFHLLAMLPVLGESPWRATGVGLLLLPPGVEQEWLGCLTTPSVDLQRGLVCLQAYNTAMVRSGLSQSGSVARSAADWVVGTASAGREPSAPQVGRVQSVLHLRWPSASTIQRSVVLEVEGPGGLVPDLDVPSALTHLAQAQGLRVRQQPEEGVQQWAEQVGLSDAGVTWGALQSVEEVGTSLARAVGTSLAADWLRQIAHSWFEVSLACGAHGASGSGLHGAFLELNVPAVTIAVSQKGWAVPGDNARTACSLSRTASAPWCDGLQMKGNASSRGRTQRLPALKVLRVIEHWLRTAAVVEERFHAGARLYFSWGASFVNDGEYALVFSLLLVVSGWRVCTAGSSAIELVRGLPLAATLLAWGVLAAALPLAALPTAVMHALDGSGVQISCVLQCTWLLLGTLLAAAAGGAPRSPQHTRAEKVPADQWKETSPHERLQRMVIKQGHLEPAPHKVLLCAVSVLVLAGHGVVAMAPALPVWLALAPAHVSLLSKQRGLWRTFALSLSCALSVGVTAIAGAFAASFAQLPGGDVQGHRIGFCLLHGLAVFPIWMVAGADAVSSLTHPT